MNKADLVAKVADKTGFKKKDAELNPQKPDKVISIPASKAPVFKAGKSLKDAVNK